MLACVVLSIPASTTSATFTMPDSDVPSPVTTTLPYTTLFRSKSLVPSADSGRFDLTAAGTTVSAQGDTGFAQNTNVVGGTANVSVSEIANAANDTTVPQ